MSPEDLADFLKTNPTSDNWKKAKEMLECYKKNKIKNQKARKWKNMYKDSMSLFFKLSFDKFEAIDKSFYTESQPYDKLRTPRSVYMMQAIAENSHLSELIT